jgi:hypothetical protein
VRLLKFVDEHPGLQIMWSGSGQLMLARNFAILGLSLRERSVQNIKVCQKVLSESRTTAMQNLNCIATDMYCIANCDAIRVISSPATRDRDVGRVVRDETETGPWVRLETVSRPKRRDRDHISSFLGYN